MMLMHSSQIDEGQWRPPNVCSSLMLTELTLRPAVIRVKREKQDSKKMDITGISEPPRRSFIGVPFPGRSEFAIVFVREGEDFLFRALTTEATAAFSSLRLALFVEAYTRCRPLQASHILLGDTTDIS